MGEPEAAEAGAHRPSGPRRAGRGRRAFVQERKWLDSSIPSLIALLGAGGLALTIDFSGPDASMGFFGVGALLLTGGILYFRSRLASYASKVGIWRNATDLNRRNAARRIGRSMVTVGVMSAGSFLVVSTGAFRKAPPDSLHQKASGTGGFSFLGESALPIYDDLNAIAGQEDDPYDLNASLLAEAKVVPLRVRMGDDASCLNLNKAIRPTLYGVNPDEFKGRFSFAEGNWSVLNQPLEADVIPAVVDQNTMMWALKMKTGDRIELLDGEGRPFHVELVGVVKGSMLQGAPTYPKKTFLNSSPSKEDTEPSFCRKSLTSKGRRPPIWRTGYRITEWNFRPRGNAWRPSKKLKTPTCRFFKAWVAWGSFWGLRGWLL